MQKEFFEKKNSLLITFSGLTENLEFKRCAVNNNLANPWMLDYLKAVELITSQET